MSNLVLAQATRLAEQFGIDASSSELIDTLKATAFRVRKDDPPVSDAQMGALLIVAGQHKLNPFTKEIFAFPDKGGIVPVVSVDGWARIINEHPAFDGMEFDISDTEGTCTIYRKDRSHPIRVTEYMDECKRNTEPWQKWKKRMIRHKSMIQCARLAFGFAGIHDPDEAERILEAGQVVDPASGEITGSLQPLRRESSSSASNAQRQRGNDVEDATVREPEQKTTSKDEQSEVATISAGQVKYLEGKINSIGLEAEAQAQMLKRLGIAAIDTTMTAEQFGVLRSELLKVS